MLAPARSPRIAAGVTPGRRAACRQAAQQGPSASLARSLLPATYNRCHVSERVKESSRPVAGGGCRGERRSLPPTLTRSSLLRRLASGPLGTACGCFSTARSLGTARDLLHLQ